MSYDTYWYGDPLLVRDYLRAEEYRRQRENYTLWLGGIYMRDAIMSSIGNAFLEKGAAPYEYMERPIPITDDEVARAKEEQEAKEAEQAEMWMKLLVKQGENWGKKEPLPPPAE